MNSLIKYLESKNISYELDKPTKDLVSFKIGGNADIVIYPSKTEQIKGIIDNIKQSNIKYTVLGCGTNCYFSDEGYNGAVISTVCINKICLEDNGMISAECGARIIDCAEFALKHSLSGLEFAYGIPGNVGGCIYMNASAFNRDMSCIVYKTNALDTISGEILELNANQHKYGMKHSVFMENKDLIILKSHFSLRKGTEANIKIEMHNNLKKRKETQPLDLPSAGSVFKRPAIGYASKYIDDAGLKGTLYGGAKISEKHAGFIVNINNASSNDIINLVSIIKERVKKKFGVSLEEEIIYFE